MNDEQIVRELAEQTKWLRVLGMEVLRPRLMEQLSSTRDRVIYEFSDGERGARDVAKQAKVSHPTVLRSWQEWLASGICAEVPGSPGRAQRLVSLTAIGIPLDVPEKGRS